MWLVVPFVLAVAVSTVKPLFVAYYLNVCVPAAALLTAAGIDALAKRSRALAGFGLAVALLHSGRLLVNWYDGVPPKDDYRTAMAFACRDAGNDGKVLYATGLSPARYYAAPECGTTTGAQRLLMIVRTTDARPPIVGWVARQTRSFTGVDVVTYVPASAPS
jgi:hypothetical protein